MLLQTQEQFDSKLILRPEFVFLIVEDEAGHYKLIEIFLRKKGIKNELHWFENGQSVLDFIADLKSSSTNKKKYIVLLDIRMPGIDGIEVLKKIKENNDFKDNPVIMLTTSADQQQAQTCYDLGCQAHIIKPPGQALLKAIANIAMGL
ncbi:MAG: response regulator [Phycisphaerae bacterium]|nr:response regulator [Phycisphaerae bacterium]